MRPAHLLGILFIAASVCNANSCSPKTCVYDLPQITILKAESGQSDDLRQFFKSNPSLLICKDRLTERTALHWAAAWGDIKLAKEAIAGGAKLSAADRNGETPLHVAARSGQNSAVEYLIKAGAPLEAVDKTGFHPLHTAAFQRHLETMHLLISHGADVNAPDSAGDGALDLSIGCWNLDPFRDSLPCVRLLIESGADVNAKNKYRSTALHSAAAYGSIEVCKALIQSGAEVNARSEYNQPITMASRFLRPEIVDLLLKNGADPNSTDYNGVTVLVDALTGLANRAQIWKAKQVQIVNLLLDAGADPNAKSSRGYPLKLAVENDLMPAAKLLLSRGAKINALDSDGLSALHAAIESNNIAMVKFLVESGADVNAGPSPPYRPYGLSGGPERAGIREYLVQHGAAAL